MYYICNRKINRMFNPLKLKTMKTNVTILRSVNGYRTNEPMVMEILTNNYPYEVIDVVEANDIRVFFSYLEKMKACALNGFEFSRIYEKMYAKVQPIAYIDDNGKYVEGAIRIYLK